MEMKWAKRCLLALILVQGSFGFRKKAEKGLRGLPREPKALLEEFEQVLGAEHREAAELRLHDFEEDLRVTFKALPKNPRGAVEAPSARYALHRLFNKRHGWQIKGLETAGGAWDAESPVLAMGDRVPSQMRELFEDRLGSYGLTLHELAVLAATMEKMFEKDVDERLKIVFRAMKVNPEDKVSHPQAESLLWTYVAVFITGSPVELLSEGEVRRALTHFAARFPRHVETKALLLHITEEVAGVNTEYDFQILRKILSIFGQRLGALEDRECQVMKGKLMTVEDRAGSGLVRLGEFYGTNKLNFHFTEGPDYLRANGVLDESDPSDPKVMIPNYLASPSNCVQPSGYYSICCFDECEALMDQVEQGLEAPMSTPEKIAALVSNLPSATQRGNRTLSPRLLGLLDEVANHHGGMVPLHGRLFAQWMHEAYPRECNYPSAGSTSRDRFAQTLDVEHVKDEERSKYWNLAKSRENSSSTETTTSRWVMKEELVDQKAFQAQVKSSLKSDLTVFGTLGFVGMAFAKLLMPSRPNMKKEI
ncbi:unnamed protein product [Effrenium voratum]|uniref:Uncharacterized protein n=1 Tax=Effrenium voratum TaxID=2562239 RepID=A0AA36N096_9DINO|nr:unnamed protein product [Effrenium voratum]|mmetsp:Transcript_84869/g.203415  ORF Transcript_84869/g.203415 Transcript_84869/m.203415 type:complete len:535 (-) Transcript_84869:63-1667(-)